MASAGLTPESKARTIQHMNADHAADLVLYLRHFGGLSAAEAGDHPVLEDISLAAMTIRTSPSDLHTVPLVPPLEDWADRRARLAEMSRTARATLGEGTGGAAAGGGVVVTRWAPPHSALAWAFFISVTGYFAGTLLVFTGNLQPGTPAWRGLQAMHVPGGPALIAWLLRAIIVPVVVIHAAEAVWLDRSRLSRYGVRRGGVLWWMWIGSAIFEGFTSFERFDALVEKERRAAGKRH